LILLTVTPWLSLACIRCFDTFDCYTSSELEQSELEQSYISDAMPMMLLLPPLPTAAVAAVVGDGTTRKLAQGPKKGRGDVGVSQRSQSSLLHQVALHETSTAPQRTCTLLVCTARHACAGSKTISIIEATLNCR
jgi:hypothetical protein